LEKHAPKARAHHRLVYVENREQILARNKAWQDANLEAYKAAINAWHKAHPARIKAIHRKWRETNPEGVKAHAHKTRAKRQKADGRHSAAEVKTLLEKQRGRCAYCRISIRPEYHVDHIVALANGGTNWISNIQLLCPPCNRRKHTTDPITYAQSIGLLL
jgi:5-methylcytosine-specific restriction endonuclease McrA